jgi:hypothetical protein
MSAEIVALMTKLETEAKRLADSQGFRWDNRHPVYRAANSAFEADDYKALLKVWIENFE